MKIFLIGNFRMKGKTREKRYSLLAMKCIYKYKNVCFTFWDLGFIQNLASYS
jgi:hypothetical protein